MVVTIAAFTVITLHHLRNLSVIVYELWLFIISGCLLSVIVYELWLFIISGCLLSVIVYELWLFIISGCLLSVIVYELWLFIIDNTCAAGRNITDVKSGIDTTLIPSPNRHETMT